MVFDEYARYYDLLYRDKNYKAEVDYVVSRIRRFSPNVKSLLELGSGTGIHAGLLAEQGFRVHGVERSPGMLARARAAARPSRNQEAAPPPVYTEGDIRTVRLGKRFDVALSLFHVMSYQATNADLSAAFETARMHLEDRGLFLFDVWYGPAVLTDRPAVRIKRMADENIEVTRLAEPLLHPDRNVVDVNYHVFVRERKTKMVNELKEKHEMRYFFNPEIEEFAERSGFETVHAEEWLTGRPPGFETWGVFFVLKAV